MGKNKNKFKGDKASLTSEVAAFASELGLASSVPEDDFGFSDFAPDKASKKLSKSAGGGTGGKAPVGKKEEMGRPGQVGGRGNDEMEEKKKKRQWNEGVGPRPELGKPLRKTDEPSSWFEALDLYMPEELPSRPPAMTFEEVEQWRNQGEKLLAAEAESYEKDLLARNHRDSAWLATVRKSGTTSDKVAAATLLVTDAAAANLRSLDMLMGMAEKAKGGKRVIAQVLEALQELFTNVLLPNRKLRFLEQQTAALAAMPKGRRGERLLLFLALEDALKRRYAALAETLRKLTTDNLEYIKEKSMKCAFELLARRPEQEAHLLTTLVNKLGDPARKIASKTGYLMLSLLAEHPAMTMVIVREVEKFVFRPAFGDRARYYAIIFLNQIILSHKGEGPAVAKRLVDLYFSLFRLVVDGRMGHRAALESYKKKTADKKTAAEEDGDPDSDLDQDARPASGKKAGGKKKAPEEGAVKGPAHEVDARLLSALLTGINRAFPFVSPDEVEPLTEKHSEDLFRMTHSHSFNTGVQALVLLYQLMSARQAVSDRFYRALYAVLLEDALPRSTKLSMLLSLCFKALRSDVSLKRVAAFCKRLLQVAQEQSPPLACGALLMVSELARAHRGLWNLILQSEEEGDDLEQFRDQDTASDDDDHDDDRGRSGRGGGGGEAPASPAPSGSGESSDEEAAEGAGRGTGHVGAHRFRPAWPAKEGYDMRKRDPLYCNADRSCMWELAALGRHAHPAVAMFAQSLLGGQHVTYNGDPLRDLAFSAFLDKFMQKKPKAASRGTSIMQPVTGMVAASAAAVGSQAFIDLEEGAVRPEDLFFHKYFNLDTVRTKRDETRKRKDAKKSDEMAGDVGSDEEDDADAFLDGIERDGGDFLGGADIAADVAPGSDGEYSYEDLARAMEEDDGTDIEEGLSDGIGEDSGSDEDGAFEMLQGQSPLRPASSEDDAGAAPDSDSDSELGHDGDADADGSDGDEDELDVGSDSEDDEFPDALAAEDDEDEADLMDERGLLRIGGGDGSDDEAEAEAKAPRDRSKKRKKREALPELASADDYLAMIEEDEARQGADKGQGGGSGSEEEEGEEERPSKRFKAGRGSGGGRGRGGGGRGGGGRGRGDRGGGRSSSEGGRGRGGRGGRGGGRGGGGRGRGGRR